MAVALTGARYGGYWTKVASFARYLRVGCSFGEQLGGGDERGVLGRGVAPDYQSLLDYFEVRYRSSRNGIASLIGYLNLYGRRIVSIGSGVGAEEILLAELGNNQLDCIEPDELSRKVHTEFIRKFKTANVVIHNSTTRTFTASAKYDVIYASGPGDWMLLDFRVIIPEAYAQFFNRFGTDNTLIVLKLYGGSHYSYVLGSKWFLKSLINAFARGTKYQLLEYWLVDDGPAMAIAGRLPDAARGSDRPDHLALFGERSGTLRYASDRPMNTRVYPWEQQIIPCAIAARKFFSLLTAFFVARVRRMERQ